MRFAVGLLVNLILLALLPLRLLRRARAAPRNAWLKIVIDRGVVELGRKVPFWVRRKEPVSLQALRDLVKEASADARVKGILVRLEAFGNGSARATSLREVLLAARAGGKTVVVHMPHGGGTLAYYIASAADRVLLGPESEVDLTGFAVEASYLRGALDRVGVEPEVLARGRYKTAGEFLEQKSMSEAQREQIGALLDVAHDALIDALSAGRKVDRARAERWVDEAPWSARAALEAGLVDAVVYDDEVPRTLDASREEGAPLTPAGRYLARRSVRWAPLIRAPYVAVVDIVGPIATEAPTTLVPMALEEPVCRALRAVREDRRAQGLLLHVSSRGGSALASDRMLREIKRVAEKKPVVAYLGDVAASGGYMVAVGAHAIVAQPTTVTGSIGVIAARFVLQPLLRRLGVATEVVKRGRRADMMSAVRPLSPDERAHFERHLDEIYDGFVAAVATGRNKSPADIEPLAGGRVHSGRDAHSHGLIDRLGGFDVAMEELKRRIGPKAERIRPARVGPGLFRTAGLLTRFIRAELPPLPIGTLGELSLLSLGEPRARAWLWSELGPCNDE